MKPRQWKKYNQKLVSRGSITLYLNEEVIKAWSYQGKRKRGGKIQYSDTSIETVLSLGYLFRLPLRQSVGFTDSICKLMKLSVPMPDYTTLSRRNKSLQIKLKGALSKIELKDGLELAIDSTGLSIYQSSGWHAQKYKGRKHERNASWRKLHIALDLHSGKVLAMQYSDSKVSDSSCFQPLLAQATKLCGTTAIKSVRADRAYDNLPCYQAACSRSIKPIIPVRRNAVSQSQSLKGGQKPNPHLKQRDETIKYIKSFPSYHKGTKEWEKQTGYHLRSRIESYMNCFKRVFGGTLKAKNESSRKTEMLLKVNLLNRMACFA